GSSFALSTRAGTECVAHLIQSLTQANPEATVLSIDGIGAFDLMSRNAMLHGLAGLPAASSALPFCRMFYGHCGIGVNMGKTKGLVVLGTPIGHAEFVRHHMRSLLADHCFLLHRLCQVGDLQTAWLLLSMCANPRANFYMRTMAPEDALEFATAHDEHMAAAVTDLLGTPADQLAVGQTAREVAQLPLCLGGLGLRCAARMAPAASWASWAD
ncbi:unnamed protein product, partial [Prorocentrum cordatum]